MVVAEKEVTGCRVIELLLVVGSRIGSVCDQLSFAYHDIISLAYCSSKYYMILSAIRILC